MVHRPSPNFQSSFKYVLRRYVLLDPARSSFRHRRLRQRLTGESSQPKGGLCHGWSPIWEVCLGLEGEGSLPLATFMRSFLRRVSSSSQHGLKYTSSGSNAETAKRLFNLQTSLAVREHRQKLDSSKWLYPGFQSQRGPKQNKNEQEREIQIDFLVIAL